MSEIAIAALQVRVRVLEERYDMLYRLVCRPTVWNALERERRNELVKDRRHRLIRDLAARLQPGNTAHLIRQIERLFSRQAVPPNGAERLVDELRDEYKGGPSPSTIYSALQKFQLR